MYAPVQRHASGGARFLAWLIDSLLVTAVAVVIIIIVHAYQQIDARTTTVNGFYLGGTETTYVLTSIGYVVMSAAVLTYFAVQWRLARMTLGQRMLGLQVLDRETGQRLSWGRALIRALWFGGALVIAIATPAVGFLLGIVALIGIAIGFGSSGQGLHDRSARSVVVRGG